MYKIIDAHCDTLGRLRETGKNLAKHSGHVRSEHLGKYEAYVQVFAAWVDTEKENPLRMALELAEVYMRETEENGMIRIQNKRDLKDVIEMGKRGAILALEDGAALMGSLGVLHMFYRLGFRAITLCWNGENEIGDGVMSSLERGLTTFGKAVVSEMQSLGMLVDVSHLAERGFWDVMENAKKPIIASHSNAKKIMNHPRNLTDAQIEAISKTGGVIGVNLFPDFLNERGKADHRDVMRHIEHILAVGGEDVVGIGTDFDGISAVPRDLSNTGELYVLLDALLRRGYKESLVKKLSYKNFARVFSECLPI